MKDLTNNFIITEILENMKENNEKYEFAFNKISSVKSQKEIDSVVSEINRRKNDHLLYVNDLNELGHSMDTSYSQLNYLESQN